MGSLTLQVLDLVRGRPAAGMTVELWRMQNDVLEWMKSVQTNADGSTEEAVLEQAEITPGIYELIFHLGDYFGAEPAGARFLDAVPVRFSLLDAAQDCHVPLLCTPCSYSILRANG